LSSLSRIERIDTSIALGLRPRRRSRGRVAVLLLVILMV